MAEGDVDNQDMYPTDKPLVLNSEDIGQIMILPKGFENDTAKLLSRIEILERTIGEKDNACKELTSKYEELSSKYDGIVKLEEERQTAALSKIVDELVQEKLSAKLIKDEDVAALKETYTKLSVDALQVLKNEIETSVKLSNVEVENGGESDVREEDRENGTDEDDKETKRKALRNKMFGHEDPLEEE